MTVPDYEIPRDVVPPGNQTGTYYIPISNLPFNVSWQEVKDHVRQVCAVDHVEIFPKSTSGWVRVKGFEHFRAAFELLNGKEFKGRAVIADDRNADRPLKVRDLTVSGSSGSANRPASSSPKSAVEPASESSLFAGGPVSYPSSIGISSPTSTASSAYGQDGGSFSMPMSPSSYMTSPGTSFSHGAIMPSYDVLTAAYPQPSMPTTTYGYYASGAEAQQPFYGYQAAPDRQPTLYNQSASYAVQPIQPYSEYYPPPPPSVAILTNQLADLTMGGAAPSGGGVVYTEQRGIHIRELSRRASDDQVRRMICDAAGREAALINLVEVPLDKEGNPRGYAIAHFRSADLARRMVDKLHGVDFKGRKLQVKLLKEGEAVGVGGCGAVAGSSRGHGHGHRSGKHHSSSTRRDEGRRAERRDKDRERGVDRGEKKTSSSSSASKGAPLVVGGGCSAVEASFCSSSSSSSKGKDKGKEKHGSKKSAVVIADGSSRRADKS
ncbi:hypothetical protein J7T55_009114 [Diaporthe amygdali]|uniref:uncharacterized protein n=1 Tax=Phomopsis amygdali TaxID=1214568 RepID=UPI0022FDC76A|nr:uncharacterized protein J7T55_009114 [Diaporthe amygdali]KAJ0118331.1 hypothetical protein J7T55_009114 [Diaporthe amygdali]